MRARPLMTEEVVTEEDNSEEEDDTPKWDGDWVSCIAVKPLTD